MTGIVRPIDQNGRVCIPKNLYKTLGIEPGDFLEVFVGRDEEDRPAVFLRKYRIKCHLCNDLLEEGKWIELHDHRVCLECAYAVYTMSTA